MKPLNDIKHNLPDSPIDEKESAEIGKGNEFENCNFQGYSYSPGAVICINDRDHKCKKNGRWAALGTRSSC